MPYSCSEDPFDAVDRENEEEEAGKSKRSDLDDVEDWAKDEVGKYTFVPS